MEVQEYRNRFYIISKGRIIGDFTNRSDAESLVKANTPKPRRKPQKGKPQNGQAPIVAFGYRVDKMQQREA